MFMTHLNQLLLTCCDELITNLLILICRVFYSPYSFLLILDLFVCLQVYSLLF